MRFQKRQSCALSLARPKQSYTNYIWFCSHVSHHFLYFVWVSKVAAQISLKSAYNSLYRHGLLHPTREHFYASALHNKNKSKSIATTAAFCDKHRWARVVSGVLNTELEVALFWICITSVDIEQKRPYQFDIDRLLYRRNANSLHYLYVLPLFALLYFCRCKKRRVCKTAADFIFFFRSTIKLSNMFYLHFHSSCLVLTNAGQNISV